MVNIAIFWTQYRNRTTVSAKRKATEMRRHNKIWLVTWTLPVSIAHWLVATAAGCTKKGAFTDDACASTKSRCASTKSRCAVSKKKEGGCFSGCRLCLHEITLRSVQNRVAH